MRFWRSAKKSASPEHEAVRNESSGHGQRTALAAFQRDFLGEHDVSNRQLAERPETQAAPWAAFVVELADVRHDARINPVLLSGLAADDFEISAFCELRPLDRRQPLPQKPQGSTFRIFLRAVSDEESPYGSPARAFARPGPLVVRHGFDRLAADEPREEYGFFRVGIER